MDPAARLRRVSKGLTALWQEVQRCPQRAAPLLWACTQSCSACKKARARFFPRVTMERWFCMLAFRCFFANSSLLKSENFCRGAVPSVPTTSALTGSHPYLGVAIYVHICFIFWLCLHCILLWLSCFYGWFFVWLVFLLLCPFMSGAVLQPVYRSLFLPRHTTTEVLELDSKSTRGACRKPHATTLWAGHGQAAKDMPLF